MNEQKDKRVFWIGSVLADLRKLPGDVRAEVGHALYVAQKGDRHPSAKPLQGFGGASVLEIVENDDGDTYRVVYTVKFADAVYCLHAFQKKSKRGVKTPRQDIELVRQRLKLAEVHHEEWRKENKP